MFKKLQAIDQLSHNTAATLAKAFDCFSSASSTQKSASMTQQRRYQESPSASLATPPRKYRSAFDLAARYILSRRHRLPITIRTSARTMPAPRRHPPPTLSASARRPSHVDNRPPWARGAVWPEDLAVAQGNYDTLKIPHGPQQTPNSTAPLFSRRDISAAYQHQHTSTMSGRHLRRPTFTEPTSGTSPIPRLLSALLLPNNGPQPALITFGSQIKSNKTFSWLAVGRRRYATIGVFNTDCQAGVWFQWSPHGALRK